MNLVTFNAPNEATYRDALKTLRRHGYREWSKMGASRLKIGTFTARKSLLRIYWAEPGDPRQFFRAAAKALLKRSVQ